MRQAGEVLELKLSDLVAHPRNYRAHPAHQVERIGKSLAQHGQYRSVVVQAGTNRIIAGHGVVEAARAAGEETILCTVLDVSDAEAQQVMIEDNALAQHAVDDNEQLLELLADLVNTEYQPASHTDAEIEDLLRGVTEPRVPDFSQSDLQERWMIVLECEGEEHQLALLERFTAEGLTCRALIG